MRCCWFLSETSLSLSLSLFAKRLPLIIFGRGAKKKMASKLVKALIRSQILPSTRRHFSAPATTQLGVPTDDLVGNHTAKWMQVLPMTIIKCVFMALSLSNPSLRCSLWGLDRDFAHRLWYSIRLWNHGLWNRETAVFTGFDWICRNHRVAIISANLCLVNLLNWR